jgi:hypothetical protein
LRSHNKLSDSQKDKEMLIAFVNDYCHLDGAFIFEIIRNNSNFITTSEVICTLWSKYTREYSRNHPKSILVGTQQINNQNEKNESVEIGLDYEEDNEKMPFHP